VAEEYSEIVTGDRAIIDLLRRLIASRVMCEMEIPRTHESWITLLLEIRNIGNTYHLLLDTAAGFEAALLKFSDREVFLECKEKGGVACRFKTRIIACNPREVLSELPKVIYRIQRRRYFRMEGPPGVEITFLSEPSTEKKMAKVKDYSAGGVAFFMETEWKLNVGDWLSDVHLNIPEKEGVIRFQIPKAAVRRTETESSYGGMALCAVEFTEISAQTRDKIFSHISRKQRVGIQRIGT
jgi:c-di-GMP-binding flagellar brake protein YcgR